MTADEGPQIDGDAARPGRRPGGGRSAKRAAREGRDTVRVPYIQRKTGTFDILSTEGLEIIERNADVILRDVGMEFHGDPEILALFRDAGADVQGERVRFEPGMARSIVQATAPREYTQHARNPENNVRIGGSNTVLSPVYGPPFVHDLDRGRRYATLEDFENLVKIHQMLPVLHHSGGIVAEPIDIPVNKRHLDMIAGHLRFSDRPFIGGLIGAERAADTVAMTKIVLGDDFVDQNCCVYAVSNTNAPLVLDADMSGSLKVYARNNQAVACTPWIMAGAMGPCTEAGTLAQLLAESTAVCALTQLIRPGAPCLMGNFATALSMQSGAPTFGNPEAGRIVLAAGQLARRLGVPLHTVGALTASKVTDAQALNEGTFGLMMAVLAGANFINHAVGWLEGGLCTGYEKSILDADTCGKMIAFCEGIDLSEDAQALDAIKEVGPGRHFLDSAHTRAHFEDAFYISPIADVNSFEQWHADGARDATERANAVWKRLLKDYEKPPIDPVVEEELLAYVRCRKDGMPDRNY